LDILVFWWFWSNFQVWKDDQVLIRTAPYLSFPGLQGLDTVARKCGGAGSCIAPYSHVLLRETGSCGDAVFAPRIPHASHPALSGLSTHDTVLGTNAEAVSLTVLDLTYSPSKRNTTLRYSVQRLTVMCQSKLCRLNGAIVFPSTSQHLWRTRHAEGWQSGSENAPFRKQVLLTPHGTSARRCVRRVGSPSPHPAICNAARPRNSARPSLDHRALS
jgi:hypothetical protein